MPCLRLAQSEGRENKLCEAITVDDNLRCRKAWGGTILPRKGEVAGACQTEGAETTMPAPCPPPPSLRAASRWRGRIVRMNIVSFGRRRGEGGFIRHSA